jgi:hypothetical protein
LHVPMHRRCSNVSASALSCRRGSSWTGAKVLRCVLAERAAATVRLLLMRTFVGKPKCGLGESNILVAVRVCTRPFISRASILS